MQDYTTEAKAKTSVRDTHPPKTREGVGHPPTHCAAFTSRLTDQYLDGSPGKQLTDFKSEFIRDFDYSYDGKQLAIIRGHRESDVVMIRDSEK